MDSQRIVIAGAGRVGYRAAEAFASRGHYVTVIERDPEFGERVAGTDRITVVQGDATDPETLEQALGGEVDVFGALTSDGETNLTAVLAVQYLAPGDPRLVARTNLDLSESYRDLVSDITFVSQSSVRASILAMGGHDVGTLDELTGILEIRTVVVGHDSPVAGERIEDADLPDGCLVVSAVGGQHSANGDTVLRAGQEYVVAVEEGVVDTALARFRG